MPSTSADLQAVRDLVSSVFLQQELMKDRDGWRRLCDGLDAITDAATASGRLEGLDAVREVVGMPPTSGGEDPDAALEAGLAAVRVTLEDRVRNHHLPFVEDPLADKLKTSGYLLEKTSESVRALRDGALAHRSEVNLVFMRGFQNDLGQIAEGIRARGYEDFVSSPADDAAYIVGRAVAAVEAGVAASDQRDLDLLVTAALPKLLSDLKGLVHEIDAELAAPPAGWLVEPPD